MARTLAELVVNCNKNSKIAFYLQGSVQVFKYGPSYGEATLRQQWEDLQERMGSEE